MNESPTLSPRATSERRLRAPLITVLLWTLLMAFAVACLHRLAVQNVEILDRSIAQKSLSTGDGKVFAVNANRQWVLSGCLLLATTVLSLVLRPYSKGATVYLWLLGLAVLIWSAFSIG